MKFTHHQYPDQIIEETDAERIAHMTTYGGWVAMPPEPEPPPPPPPIRRVWQTAADFWAEFSQQEQVDISISEIPAVRALVVSLSVWPAEMWSDDARVQAGFKALTQSGLLTKARANKILNPPGLKE
jgi:hypothetical protein